jgi:LytR cell envelope-related transcriptional attenuator
MAWLGAIVVLGLTVLAVDVLRERIGDRRARRRAARGLPPVVWSVRRRLATLGISLGAVAAVFGIVFALHGGGGTSSPKTNRLNVIPSTTTSAPTTTTKPTTTTAAAHPPQQVRVAVINASGVQNAGRQKSNALKAIGYQTVGLGNGTPRTGTGVACKAGFEQDAALLATNVGGNATVEPFPNPPPPAAANADCVVQLGK